MSRNDIWETQYGERIPIRDMEDTHLINTINFLFRSYSEVAILAGVNVLELLKRMCPQWGSLLMEVRRRGVGGQLVRRDEFQTERRKDTDG